MGRPQTTTTTTKQKNKATRGGDKINKILISVTAECWEKEGSLSYFLDFGVCENFNNKRFLRIIKNKNVKAPINSPPTRLMAGHLKERKRAEDGCQADGLSGVGATNNKTAVTM